MSDDKCPRCGKDPIPGRSAPGAELAQFWHCGTYREPTGNIYESELCETRQELRFQKAEKEKAEAELEESQQYANRLATIAKERKAELIEADYVLAISRRDGMAAYERANRAEWLLSLKQP